MDALNKSAILFLCAAFEAFLEDLATSSFDHIVDNVKSPNDLPLALRKAISQQLKADHHELSVWAIAGDGWKTVVGNFKKSTLKRHVETFNTPKHGNIASLFKGLVSYEDIDKCYRWRGISESNSKAKLNKLVVVRGALAHGERPAPVVGKQEVVRYLRHLAPLSVRMSNELRLHCHSITGKYPWPSAFFGKIV